MLRGTMVWMGCLGLGEEACSVSVPFTISAAVGSLAFWLQSVFRPFGCSRLFGFVAAVGSLAFLAAACYLAFWLSRLLGHWASSSAFGLLGLR